MKITSIVYVLITLFTCLGGKRSNSPAAFMNPSSQIRFVEYNANVVIKKTLDGLICIYIAGNKAINDQFYLFQTGYSYDVEYNKEKVLIAYRESYLLVKDVNAKTYHLFTIDGSGPPSYEVEGYTPIGRFEGFGLGVHTNSEYYSVATASILQHPGNPLPEVSETANCKCFKNETAPTYECTSGGEGATSCGESSTAGEFTESCNVNCGEGYFACCYAN